MAKVQSKGYKDSTLKSGTVEITHRLEKMEGNGCKLNQKRLGQAYYLLPPFLFSICFPNAKYKVHYNEERNFLERNNRLHVEKLIICCFFHGTFLIFHFINWLLGFCLLLHYSVGSKRARNRPLVLLLLLSLVTNTMPGIL